MWYRYVVQGAFNVRTGKFVREGSVLGPMAPFPEFDAGENLKEEKRIKRKLKNSGVDWKKYKVRSKQSNTYAWL